MICTPDRQVILKMLSMMVVRKAISFSGSPACTSTSATDTLLTIKTEPVSPALPESPLSLMMDSSTLEESISGRKKILRISPRPLNSAFSITAINRENTRMIGTCTHRSFSAAAKYGRNFSSANRAFL